MLRVPIMVVLSAIIYQCALIGALLFVTSCGVKHNVDGEVDFNVNVDEIIIRVEFFCDKELNGVPVYNTRDDYRQCVRDVLEREKDEREGK